MNPPYSYFRHCRSWQLLPSIHWRHRMSPTRCRGLHRHKPHRPGGCIRIRYPPRTGRRCTRLHHHRTLATRCKLPRSIDQLSCTGDRHHKAPRREPKHILALRRRYRPYTRPRPRSSECSPYTRPPHCRHLALCTNPHHRKPTREWLAAHTPLCSPGRYSRSTLNLPNHHTLQPYWGPDGIRWFEGHRAPPRHK